MVSQEKRNKTFSDFALASQMNNLFIQPNHDLLFAITMNYPGNRSPRDHNEYPFIVSFYYMFQYH